MTKGEPTPSATIRFSPPAPLRCKFMQRIHDSKGVKEVFEKLYDTSHDEELWQKLFADGGYQGELGKWVKDRLGLNIRIVKRN